MFASISVTTYNRKDLSKYCIDTIHKYTPRREYELIVVDNGSTDGTVPMLEEFKARGIIDKLVVKHPNSLGKAINDAWKLADQKADWLIVFSNDLFCMKGWFENLKLIIKSEFKPEYIFACLRMPGFMNMIPFKARNGGSYTIKKGRWKSGYPFGGGLVIKHGLVKKHKIRFGEIAFTYYRKSIYSILCRGLHRLGLRFVALGKPCILMHDCDFADPKYKAYYEGRFGVHEVNMDDDHARRVLKLDRLQKRGYTTNPDAYYEGSDYTIGPYYRNALNALEEG